MRILLDTSALYKRYALEGGSAQVQSVCEQADGIVLAAHCMTEIASVFARHLHDGAISEAQCQEALALVTGDFSEFDVQPLNPTAERHTIEAMQRSRLQAMDALHIGTAQAAGVDLFVTADREQAKAAKQAGLTVEMVIA